MKINALLHPLLPRDNSHRWNRTRGKRVAPGFTFIVTRELYGKDRGEREGTLVALGVRGRMRKRGFKPVFTLGKI